MANQFFVDEYTTAIQKVVREVVNDPSMFLGSKYLPSVVVPAHRIRTEVIEAYGGVTNEHVPGTNPKYIKSISTRVQEYIPPSYKETILYDEQRILYLRELGGNNMLNVRGIRDYIDRDIQKLNLRIETRIELLRWQTIFNGGFSYLGKTISFGIPASNRVVPVGAVWSSDGILPNNSANPVLDLRYWVMGNNEVFRKYVITGIVMNGKTASWILDNTNTRAYLTSYGANPALDGYDINKALQFLVPGLPPVTVYNGWYRSETVNADQTVTLGTPTFFIPDGYIFFEAKLPDGDKIGDFVQALNLATGTIESPGAGKFVVVEENIAPGTQGGPKNPFIDITGGVYGGPKLDRAFDVLTAKVIA